MSNELRVMRSVTNVIEFIKSEVLKNLINANERGFINHDKETIKKLSSVIEDGIQSSYSKSMNEIMSLAKTL